MSAGASLAGQGPQRSAWTGGGGMGGMDEGPGFCVRKTETRQTTAAERNDNQQSCSSAFYRAKVAATADGGCVGDANKPRRD